MPLALFILGIIAIAVAYRGTQAQLFTLLKGDFTGSGNFIYWVIAIGVVGAVGRIPGLKGLSNAFLVLIILVLFLANKGFFAQFNNAIRSSTASSTSQAGVSGSFGGNTTGSITETATPGISQGTTVTGSPLYGNVTGTGGEF